MMLGFIIFVVLFMAYSHCESFEKAIDVCIIAILFGIIIATIFW